MITPTQILADPDFKPHWNDSITDDQYHADRTCIGSTQLRSVLDSPKTFYWEFFKNAQREESDAMRLGKLVHKAILEGESFRSNYCVVPDFGDQRSTANKEKKAKWLADRPPHQIMISQDDLDIILGIVESITDHPQAKGLLTRGKPEVAGYFKDPETGIKLKFKPDFLSFSGKSMVDLKTTRNSSKRQFMSSVYDFRYDIQLFMYATGVKAITGQWPELISIIAVEKKQQPFESAVYYFNDFSLQQAEEDYHKALRRLKKCIDENKWPQRQTMIESAEIPQWFVYNNAQE